MRCKSTLRFPGKNLLLPHSNGFQSSNHLLARQRRTLSGILRLSKCRKGFENHSEAAILFPFSDLVPLRQQLSTIRFPL
jgi:hypothetical protein